MTVSTVTKPLEKRSFADIKPERIVGVGERQAQVLDEVLDHKAGLVVAVERLGRQALHGAGLTGAAQDHLTGLLQIEAAQLGKCHGVCHADHAGAQRLVRCEDP